MQKKYINGYKREDEKMKLLVISDIHGSLHYASQIPLIWERENPDKLVLLGDLYYHGPRNPLTEEYKPMKVAEILNEFKDSLIAIRGNCDAEVDQMISDFPLQDYVKEEINGKIIYFTHGHHYNLDHLPEEKIDILIYGHVHTGFIKEENGIIIANPGSISLPKNDTAHSYLIIEPNKLILKDVDGTVIEERII